MGVLNGCQSEHEAETARLDDATQLPPPNVQSSTPGEFAARWNAASDVMRQGWLDGSRKAFEAQERCFREMHDERLERSTVNAHDAEETLRPLLGCVLDAEEWVNEATNEADKVRALCDVIVAQARVIAGALELLGVRR